MIHFMIYKTNKLKTTREKSLYNKRSSLTKHLIKFYLIKKLLIGVGIHSNQIRGNKKTKSSENAFRQSQKSMFIGREGERKKYGHLKFSNLKKKQNKKQKNRPSSPGYQRGTSGFWSIDTRFTLHNDEVIETHGRLDS